jgi:hypothetical protein
MASTLLGTVDALHPDVPVGGTVRIVAPCVDCGFEAMEGATIRRCIGKVLYRKRSLLGEAATGVVSLE